ncbi:uncharacterized protein LOC143085352 [Mytilus galloprovincialis]|uniref:uncharacterized protein LOC143085352 n=1 Tax=Mytilus galloprovincialis TaxID=29158 RepID=UPI003F7C28F8
MKGSLVLLIGLLSFCSLVYPASGLNVEYNNRCGYGYVWRHQTKYYCKYNTECCQIKGTWYCLSQIQSQLGCRTFQILWGSHYKLFDWMINNTTKLTARYQTVPRFRKTTRLTSTTRPTTSVCRNKYRHRHRQRHTSKTYTKATIPIPHTTRPTTTVYVTKHRYRYIQRYGQRYRQRYRSKTYTKATTIPQTTISSTHSTYSDAKKTIITDYILGFGIPLAVVIACFATVVLKAKCNDMTRVKRKTYADMVLQKSSAPPVTNEIPEYDNACLCLHQFDTVPYRQRAGQPNETDTNDIVDRNAAICQDGYATKTALFSSAENVNETSEPPENLATADLPTYEEARFLSNCLYETSL